ncbi:hypothetical protein BC828DRAFT_386671 [Blastocladiella britannica]|nr:hypothetical protein BC828DRAFT_386671 [Blastocladiella britannica]
MPGIAANPDIIKAYEDVRDDKTETNWLIATYEGDTDKLVLGGSGTQGLSELTSHFKDDMVAYAYVRMKVGNDHLSQRVKFVLIQWIGSAVKVIRKARASVHLSEVKQTLQVFSVEVSANTVADLREDAIVLKLKKAMGANYDRQASEY